MKDEEIKLPHLATVPLEYHDTIKSLMRQAVRLNCNYSTYMERRSDAWLSVTKTLDKLCPNWWQTGDKTAVDAAINAITKAFESTASNTKPLPFNLEAAKRGEIVIHGGKEKRWIGFSSIEDGLNIVESSSGVGYAADCDLSMKPKPMRTVYVNIDKNQNITVHNDLNLAQLETISSPLVTVAYPVKIPA